MFNVGDIVTVIKWDELPKELIEGNRFYIRDDLYYTRSSWEILEKGSHKIMVGADADGDYRLDVNSSLYLLWFLPASYLIHSGFTQFIKMLEELK